MKRPSRPSRALWPEALVLAGCLAFGCSAGERVESSRPLSVGVSSAPASLNDVLSSGESIERELFELLYLSLVESSTDLSKGPQTYSPELAEDWSFSEDRRELTFRLRRDARWSDGVPITARDVRFTWQAQTSDEISWSFADLKRHIVDVVVLDDWTVRFVFDEVSANQLAHANEGVILPSHVWSELPFERWRQDHGWFVERMVTSGPFRISRWQPGEAPTFVRNEHYFDPSLPRIERVDFVLARDDGTRLRMLQAGDVDFVSQLRPRNVSQVESSRGLRVIRYPRRQHNYVAWNLSRPWFRSPRVRRALAHAVDRKAIIETVLDGEAVQAISVVPTSLWAHDDSITPLAFDPEEARRLLAAEGWIDRDGDGLLDREGLSFRFELLTNNRSEVRWEALQVIREQLRRIGVGVVVRRFEFGTLLAALQSGEFDAALAGMSPDTTLDMSFTLHTDAISDGYNFSRYSNPEADRLIEAINRSDEVEEIRDLAHRLQRLVHRDQPLLMLWEPLGLAAANADLENVEPNAVSELRTLPYWSWRRSEP